MSETTKWYAVELSVSDGNDCDKTDFVIEATSQDEALTYCCFCDKDSLEDSGLTVEAEFPDEDELVLWITDPNEPQSEDGYDCGLSHSRTYYVLGEYDTREEALKETSIFHGGPIEIDYSDVEDILYK